MLASEGTAQDPLTDVTEPVEPVTAYPLQLVLDTLLPLMFKSFTLGANNEMENVKAEPHKAKSISEPITTIANVEDFTMILPFVPKNSMTGVNLNFSRVLI